MNKDVMRKLKEEIKPNFCRIYIYIYILKIWFIANIDISNVVTLAPLSRLGYYY